MMFFFLFDSSFARSIGTARKAIVFGDITDLNPTPIFFSGLTRVFKLPGVILSLCLTILFLVSSTESFAVVNTRFSVATGNWNSTSTWSATSGGAAGASVPDNTSSVTIERGFNVTVDINNAVASSVQIGGLAIGNGTLTFAAGSQLSVDNEVIVGNGVRTGSLDFTSGGILMISVNGTGTLTVTTIGTFTPGLGTIDYNDNAAQIVATTAALGAPYNNLTLSNSGIKTISGVTVNGVLSLEGTATASTSPTYGTNAILQYNTSTSRTAGVNEWITPFAATGGVIIANTGVITLNAAKVFNTGVPLAIMEGSTLATGNLQLNFGGDYINDLGILTAGSSPIIITGTSALQNIAGFTTTGPVSLTKTAGTATLTGNVNGAGLTMNGTGGTLNLGIGYTHTFSSTWTRTNGTLHGGSSIIKLGAGFSGTGGTFTAGTGTVEWNAAGAQTIAAVTYFDLTLSGSGVKTMSGVSTINNHFTIAGSASTTPATILTVTGLTKVSGTGKLTLGASDILSNTGVIALDGGTFETGATIGNNETVGTLRLTNTSTLKLGTGIHALNFAASSGVSWTTGKVLTISGWTGGYNGTASATAGRIFVGSSATDLTASQIGQIRFFNGATYFAATILSSGEVVPTSTINFYSKATGNLNLLSTWTSDITLATNIPPADFISANQLFNIRNNATPTISANWTVSGINGKIIIGNGVNACNFTIPAALVLSAPTDISNLGTLTLSTSGVLTGIVFGTLAIGSKVDYARAGTQTVIVAPYYNLTLSGTNAKTITGLTTVNGNFTLGGTASTTGVSSDITIGGNVVLGNGTTFVAGAFTHNVKGNWTNNGGAFTNIGSTINFNSTTANQLINGTAVTQIFENLTIAKSNQKVSITGSTTLVQVLGILTMTSGNIDCGSSTLELGISTSTVGTLATTPIGNIIGTFKRWFNTTGTYAFPIGSAIGSGTSVANRNALLTFSNLTNGSLTCSFVATDPGSAGLPLAESSITVINQFTEGYWSIVAANSLASTDYALELTGTGFISYGQDAEVRIVKRPTGGGSWILDGNHMAMAGATAKRIGLNGFSEFTHATRCGGTNAGPDQTVSNTANFIMSATLVAGTGAWTVESGNAGITSPTSPTTMVTGVAFGTSVTLRWTQTDGSCVDFDLVTLTNSSVRNTDLTNPDPNIVTAPAGTFVIAMDSLNYAPTYFNSKAYGLVVKLLNNKIGVRWIINSAKVHDGIDFSASATRILPTAESASMRNFKGGPFLIFPQDSTGARAVITAFNSGLANKVNVYQLTSANSVDERYRLTQRPKVAVLNNGGNGAIHAAYMTNAGIQVDSNYTILTTAENLFQQCYTFASEPHSVAVIAVLDSIRSYVLRGGNFLAECLTVDSYENSVAGHYQTTNGLTIRNITPAEGYAYPNGDLSFGQYLGTFDPVGINGAEKNWSLTASAFINDGYKIQSGSGASDTLIGQSVSKLADGAGHLVFYTGAHTYAAESSESMVNGERAYFNAMLTPTGQAQCGNQNFDADLAVTKSATPTNLCLGAGNITYKIVIVNNGLSTNPATGLMLQDVLPAGVSFVSSIVSQGSYNSMTGVWTIGSLARNEKDSISLIVTPVTAGLKINKAYVNKYQFDFEQSNDTSSVSAYINTVSTGGTIAASQSLCTPADPVTFTSALAASGTGTISYQWQSNMIGCSNGDPWINIMEATSATYDAPPGLTTTTYYRRVATSAYFGSTCSEVSNCLTVTVGLSASCSITGNDNVCPGSTNTYSTTIGMTSYSWSITGSGTISGSTIDSTVMVIAGSNCGSYTLSVTATLGNCSAVCVQSFNVHDVTPPTIACATQTTPISCPANPFFIAPTATDACDAAVSISFSDITNQGSCAGTYSTIRTWTATDDCGNSATCSRTIVVQDVTPPTIICATQITPINCPAAPVFVDPTATDACDATVSVTFSDVTTQGSCIGTYSTTRTWTATDDCGNSSTCSRTIVVQDVTPPAITCMTQATPISCPATPVFVAPTATDTCDATVSITFSDVTITGSCAGTYGVTRTWTATDDCGNSATCSRTIMVQDISPPTITCATQVSPINCTASPVFVAPTATDACDATVSITFLDVTNQGSCAGTYSTTRTWTATDDCGNSASCSRTIVVHDITPPVCITKNITVSINPNIGSVSIAGSQVDNGSMDVCGGVTFSVIPSMFTCNNEGPNLVTLTVTDLCGNSSSCSAIVTVEECFNPCVHINAWVYLEGSATNPNGPAIYTLPLRTTLNELHVLPGQTLVDPFFGNKYTPPGQPYNTPPWNYMGMEGDAFDSGGMPPGDAGYPSTAVDWVLVSLRTDSAGTGGPVCQAAALLSRSGYIDFVEPFDCCNLNLLSSYYLVIEHRNHLLIMSPIPVAIIPGVDSSTITYDFRMQQSYIDDPFMTGVFARQKELLPQLPGVFSMFAGNGNQTNNVNSDVDINFDDRSLWEDENGDVGFYRTGDYNMNGDTNFNDRLTWERSNGRFTSVPRN